MSRIYNFSAGPSMLPEEVIFTARSELSNWRGIGISIMEVSHRGDEFKHIVEESERDFRALLAIPENYQVLFLQGGARLQFAMVPMNLLENYKKAVYIASGVWSELAIEEAKVYCDVHLAANAKRLNYTGIPDQVEWDFSDHAAYFYYVDNETVNGIEFHYIPDTDLPLVCDMSSNLLSRPFDISRYGLIFACAQKNLGLSGITIIIIREDLLERKPLPLTPSYLRYSLHARDRSLFNTPPTFAWYMSGLVFKWLQKQGGIGAIAKQNKQKADKLYAAIDKSDFYHNSIDPRYRSRMNIVFTLSNENLNRLFLEEAAKSGLTNLKGHRLLGGIRASIYNAMPEKGVDTLTNFMKQFEKQHG